MAQSETQLSNGFDARVTALSDQQILTIVDAIAGEHAEQNTPAGEKDQAQALYAAFTEIGERVDTNDAMEADPASAGLAARELLRFMASFPELRLTVDEWLDNPPRQEAAAIPLILAAPAVFAGCIAVLHVVGHVRFRRTTVGTWEIDYNQTSKAPMDKTLRDAMKMMAALMRSLVPGK